MLWRHNHRKCSDGSRNYYMQAIAGPESLFDAPLFPTNSSHQCCYERAGWGGRQNWVFPRARETLGTSLPPSRFPLLKGQGDNYLVMPPFSDVPVPCNAFWNCFGTKRAMFGKCSEAKVKALHWRSMWIVTSFLFAVNCSVEQKSLHVELNGSGKHD